MSKYYSLKKINKIDATYNVIFGERSNGKTYACLKQGLENYAKDGSQFVYLRRWSVDVKPKTMNQLFSALITDGAFNDLFPEFEGIIFRTGRFYLVKSYNKEGKPVYSDKDIIGFAMSLAETEHNKSISYPKVTTIIFDEFLTAGSNLPNEFVLFMNTISTVVRQRTNVKIYMLGNTVNKFSPYFREMGLTNIQKQKQGTIDVYKFGNTGLKVAVEYAENSKLLKKNNYYFAFDNPKLKMITGGAWEIGIYPHAPITIKPKDIKFIYFIQFSDKLYQCEIVQTNKDDFTYIHLKTTPLKNDDKDLIYSLEYDPRYNHSINILRPRNEIERKIALYYTNNRIYYQDNSTGNAIENYLNQCKGV